MVRNAPAAEASFAAILDRSKLGTAIAAMIRMIATTIKSSINEKPFCFLITFLSKLKCLNQNFPTLGIASHGANYRLLLSKYQSNLRESCGHILVSALSRLISITLKYSLLENVHRFPISQASLPF